MKKTVIWGVLICFVGAGIPISKPAYAGDSREALPWIIGVLGGLAIVGAYVGRRQATTEEYATQRYKIDADTTLAAPGALGDRESSEFKRPKEGDARIYSPLPGSRSPAEAPPTPPRHPTYWQPQPTPDYSEDIQPVSLQFQALSTEDKLEAAEHFFDDFGAIPQERRAVGEVMEEAMDPHRAVFTRERLEGNLVYLRSLQRKVSRSGNSGAQRAINKLVGYVEINVLGGAS